MHSSWSTVLGATQPAGAAPAESGGAPVEGTATQGVPGGAHQGPPPGMCGGDNPYSMLIMMGLMFVVFYFLLIRPQQKKQKEHQNMLAAIQKGDEVVTAGGMIGKVSGVTDKLLTIEVSEKVRVRVLKSQVVDKYQG